MHDVQNVPEKNSAKSVVVSRNFRIFAPESVFLKKGQ